MWICMWGVGWAERGADGSLISLKSQVYILFSERPSLILLLKIAFTPTLQTLPSIDSTTTSFYCLIELVSLFFVLLP